MVFLEFRSLLVRLSTFDPRDILAKLYEFFASLSPESPEDLHRDDLRFFARCPCHAFSGILDWVVEVVRNRLRGPSNQETELKTRLELRKQEGINALHEEISELHKEISALQEENEKLQEEKRALSSAFWVLKARSVRPVRPSSLAVDLELGTF